MIPVMFSTSQKPGEVAHYTLLEKDTSEVILKNVADSDWVKVNPGTVGFYRTQYPPHLLEQFIAPIRDMSLPPLDRLGLLDDLFAMVIS
jgi:puromycin-sensitive aminopeptidase